MQILLYNNNDDAEVSFPIFSFIFFFYGNLVQNVIHSL